MNPINVLSYFAQVGLLIVICASLPRVLRLRSPALQHAFWRTLLAVCLLLPFVEPRQPHEMVFVPAPVQAAGAAAGLPAPRPAPAQPPFDWVRATSIVLAAGIVGRLGWIAVGLLRLRRMRRHAAEPALGFDDLQQTIGAFAPIRWSAEATHPVTFGVVRPIVVLPYAIKSVDAAAQRAVVAHELHHVKRRDWLWTIVEEIVRSVFWFHPAMWWLISRVQLARETVVDELSILTTNARRAYLDTLLAFADDSALRSSPAFSARRHLFHRVMLLSKEGGMSSIRVATASCALALALVAGAWTAVSAFPLRGDAIVRGAQPQSQAQKPPRDPRSPADYYRLAQEYWEKANRDLSLTPEQTLEVVLKGIDMEDRALAIDPDYANALMGKSLFLRMQSRLTTDTDIQLKLRTQAEELRRKALDVSPMPPPPPPPPPGAHQMEFMPEPFARRVAELQPLRIGGDIRQPAKIRDVRPVYPPIAQSARVQGVVIVEVLIGADGFVEEARVLRSIPLLDQAALDAVRQWAFTPVMVNGTPQPVLMTLTVNFMLQ